MLTRLREIVEKVASAPRLNEALDILVTDICAAMETEVCSVYLADNDRRCYYLMATRGLKKPRGRIVALAFDEGLVGLVGRLAEPGCSPADSRILAVQVGGQPLHLRGPRPLPRQQEGSCRRNE